LKEIILTRGEIAIVDDEDYIYLQDSTWRKLGKYAVTSVRNGKKTTNFYMHKMIMRAGKGQIVDHINHDTLDNRKCNLRYASKAQNQQNQIIKITNSTGYKGVWLHKKTGRYIAQIGISPSRSKKLGRFDTPEEAAKAYNKAALEHFGEFAVLNRIKGE
jgi:hypothetical protein